MEREGEGGRREGKTEGRREARGVLAAGTILEQPRTMTANRCLYSHPWPLSSSPQSTTAHSQRRLVLLSSARWIGFIGEHTPE